MFSCSTEARKIIETWDNGNPKVVHEFIYDSDSSYNLLLYNERGSLVTKGRMDGEEQNGEWNWWFDSGNIKDIAYLKDGFYVDKRIHFNEKGDTTIIEVIYEPTLGVCYFGQQIYFDNDNRLIVYNTNTKGVREGLGFHFNVNGDTIGIFNYANGETHGLKVEFYDNGLISCFGNFENGIEEGKWVLFDSFGTPVQTDVYRMGEKVGEEEFKDENPNKYPIRKGETKLDYYKRITAGNNKAF
jgi:antitoxin component YwqK of YwqJK toxin-antitoxin module